MWCNCGWYNQNRIKYTFTGDTPTSPDPPRPHVEGYCAAEQLAFQFVIGYWADIGFKSARSQLCLGRLRPTLARWPFVYWVTIHQPDQFTEQSQLIVAFRIFIVLVGCVLGNHGTIRFHSLSCFQQRLHEIRWVDFDSSRVERHQAYQARPFSCQSWSAFHAFCNSQLCCRYTPIDQINPLAVGSGSCHDDSCRNHHGRKYATNSLLAVYK